MQPTLKFFNTATRQKETFTPMKEGKVKMYTCGPTVYHYAHIGNFRTYVFEDILRRTLKLFGYAVEQVMNITDVDDKTIKGAIRESKTLSDYVEPYTVAFFEDMKTLGIEDVEHHPKATDYIPQMIEMIQQLIDKGAAYAGADGSVYFSIRKFPNYGALSHLKLDELQQDASERTSSDEYDKDSASDFVLWKGYDDTRDGNIFWESPWGKGRPGWHLECSAMATAVLGNTIDIHCGAVDNIFPHHENEIAQSEACTGHNFVNYWLHSEHLIVEGKKMSKSLGNFFTLRDILEKGYSGKEVRYLLLSVHYKTQLNFTEEGLAGARHTLQRLNDFVFRVKGIDSGEGKPITALLEKYESEFNASLADDLNISQALAHLFEMIREVNSLIDQNAVGIKERDQIIALLKKWDTILHVIDFEQKVDVPEEVQNALLERTEARKNKDWKEADRLRDLITSHGFVIEDSPTGPVVKKEG